MIHNNTAANHDELGQPIDLERYRSILESGVQNQIELELAFELLSKLEPDDSGVLIEKAKELGVEFVFEDIKIPTVGAATSLTSSRMKDRTSPEVGTTITFGTVKDENGSEFGANLVSIKHELVHAVPFSELPEKYQQAFKADAVTDESNLHNLYRGVVSNIFADEALAMSSHLSLVEAMEQSGIEVKDFPAQEIAQELNELIENAASSGSDQFSGIRGWLNNHPFYSPAYRMTALQLAVEERFGGSGEERSVEQILKNFTSPAEDGSGRVFDSGRAREIFKEQIMPLAQSQMPNIALTLAGMSPEGKGAVLNALRLVQGGMSPGEEAAFFRDDLDHLVREFALILGDGAPELSEIDFQSRRSEEPTLPLKTKPVKEGNPSEFQERPAELADKVEVLGKYTEILAKLDATTDKAVIDNMPTYLSFAEHCDPLSAARVYSRLIQLGVDDGRLSNSGRKELGISLLKSGYEDQGMKILEDAIDRVTDEYGTSFGAYKHDLKYFIETGRQSIIERYLDRIIEMSAEEMDELSDWVKTNHAYFPEHDSGHSRIRRVIFKITEAAAEAKDDQLEEGIALKIEQQIDRLWPQLDTWMKTKITHYEQNIAGGYTEYGSIDELTSINPQTGGGNSFDDTSLLIGFDGNSEQNLNPAGLVEEALSSPLTFRRGFEILKDYPNGQVKLHLYSEAAKNLPDDFTDRERTRLISDIKKALKNFELGYKAWGYVTAGSHSFRDPKIAGRVPTTKFENTEVYQNTTETIASIYLGASKDALKLEGIKTLSALPHNTDFLQHTIRVANKDNWLGDYHREFNPALVRASALTNILEDVPDYMQRPVISMILDRTLEQVNIRDDYESLQISLLRRVGEFAFSKGFDEIVEVVENVIEHLYFELQAIDYEPGFGSQDSLEEQAKKVRTIIQSLQAVKDGDSLEPLLDRIEQDTVNKRGHFSLKGLIRTLEYLGEEPGTDLITPANAAQIERLSKLIVDRYVQSVGKSEYEQYFTDEWNPLVKALKQLPIAEDSRDRIISYLIDRGTPRSGVVLRNESDTYGLSKVYDSFSLLEFVLGNPDLPNSEAMLVDRVGEGVKSLGFSRLDQRVLGVARGLSWMYQRLADSNTVLPEARDELAILRVDEDYQKAVEFLFAFTTPPQEFRPIEEVEQDYRSAIEERDLDALADLREEILHYNGKTIQQTKDQLEKLPEVDRRGQRTSVLLSDLGGTMLDTVYSDWKRLRSEGDPTLSDELFELLTSSEEIDEVIGKIDIYREMLQDPDLSLDERRVVFEDLSRSNVITEYAKRTWEDLKAAGSVEREELFYKAVLPIFGGVKFGKQADHLLALVEDLELDDLKRFTEAYTRFRENPSEFRFDPLDEFGWEIYSEYYQYFSNQTWRSKLAEIAETFLVLGDGEPDWPEGYDRDYTKHYGPTKALKHTASMEEILSGRYQSEVITHPTDRFSYLAHQSVHDRFTREPTDEEREQALNRLHEVFLRRDRLEDRVTAKFVETPKIFENQPELVQFLITRYFQNLSVGERQDLMHAMEGVSDERALSAFFEKTHTEKIGQFLSVWPEVPKEKRDELAKLQENVAPSDFEEVREMIRRQIADPYQAGALIDNMEQTPIGSGTIGEVYRSRLATGKEVVVKVITPSKERNFRKSLEIMQEVQHLLDLYGDEIRGSREASRFIGMYIEMVEKELDFRNEVDNHERFVELYGDVLKTPYHYRELSSEKVLIQEYIPNAVKITGNGSEVSNAQSILESVEGHLFTEQIFMHGFYHSDLQPGNVLVDKHDESWIVDFGQMGTLSEGARAVIPHLLLAYERRSPSGVADVLEQISEQTDSYSSDSRAELEEQIREIMEAENGAAGALSERLSGLLRSAGDAGLLVNNDFLQVVKGIATLDGTKAQLHA